MDDKTKSTSAEMIIKIIKRLQNGENVLCPLCKNGMLSSTIKDFETSSCFICSSCGQMLNID